MIRFDIVFMSMSKTKAGQSLFVGGKGISCEKKKWFVTKTTLSKFEIIDIFHKALFKLQLPTTWPILIFELSQILSRGRQRKLFITETAQTDSSWGRGNRIIFDFPRIYSWFLQNKKINLTKMFIKSDKQKNKRFTNAWEIVGGAKISIMDVDKHWI